MILSTLLWGRPGFEAVAGPPQEPAGRTPLPFSVFDLQRRADALRKAAEGLGPLLQAWDSRRLSDGQFQIFFLERVELLSRMSKDIADDRNLKQLARTKQKTRGDGDGWERPSTPTALSDALRLSEDAVRMAGLIQEQAMEVASDVGAFEVRVDELAKPDPVVLCKRLKEVADRLGEAVRKGRLSRQP